MIRLTSPTGKQRVVTGKVVSYGGNYYARVTDEHGETRDYGAYSLREDAEGGLATELHRLARKVLHAAVSALSDPTQPSDYAGDGGSFELPDRLVTETEDDL